MGENLQHAAETTGAADEMLTLVPGFKGYDSRQDRRASDAAQRELLATRLLALKEPLDRMAGKLMHAQRIDCLANVDKIRKQIEEEIGRIRFAGHDCRRFFKAGKVDAETLELIYEFDVDLHHRIDCLQEAVEMVAGKAENPVKAGWECRKIAATFRALDRALDQRQELLQGIG